MTLSKRTLSILIAAACLTAVGLASPSVLALQEFSCAGDQCEPTATCSGDYAELDGCFVTCYLASGESGWIDFNGMARCRGKE